MTTLPIWNIRCQRCLRMLSGPASVRGQCCIQVLGWLFWYALGFWCWSVPSLLLLLSSFTLVVSIISVAGSMQVELPYEVPYFLPDRRLARGEPM